MSDKSKMETKELMRGNVLARIKDGLVAEVKEVLTTRILYLNPDLSNTKLTTSDIKNFEPIPLTKHILIDLGFEQCSKHANYIELEIKSEIPSEHIVVRVGLQRNYFSVFNHSECNFTEMQFLKEVEYVHKLQNLCFEFNQELTIKEPINE